MKGLVIIATVICSVAPCASPLPLLQSATQPQSRDAESLFEETLREIDRKAGRIVDLRANFRQLKHTALLKKPMQSEGVVRIIADPKFSLTRWDTTKPTAATTLITRDELRIHTPNQKLLEIYPIKQGWSQLAASPLPRFEALRRQFTIDEWSWPELESSVSEKRVAVKLTPKETEIRDHLLEVRILIDRESACAVAAEVLYPDHDRLELSFTNIQLNTGIKADDLELKIPPNTTVSRPLESGATSSDN